MTVLDVNILLYAFYADTPQHSAVAAWLESAVGRGDAIGLPWPVIWGFLRIGTSRHAWPKPVPMESLISVVNGLLARPNVRILGPGPRHFELLHKLAGANSTPGPMLSDIVLAAIAIENAAILASTDADFARIESLRWLNPLKP